MAITLSSLIPAKEATGVLLSSSFSITADSDTLDLDPSSIVFTLNGVDATADLVVVETTSTSFDLSRVLADLDYGQEYVGNISISDVGVKPQWTQTIVADGTSVWEDFFDAAGVSLSSVPYGSISLNVAGAIVGAGDAVNGPPSTAGMQAFVDLLNTVIGTNLIATFLEAAGPEFTLVLTHVTASVASNTDPIALAVIEQVNGWNA